MQFGIWEWTQGNFSCTLQICLFISKWPYPQMTVPGRAREGVREFVIKTSWYILLNRRRDSKSRNYDPHQSVKGSCFSTSVFLEWLRVSYGWVWIKKHIALKKCATTRICQASAWPSIVMTCWIEVHSCHRCLAKLGETAVLFSIPFQPHEGGGWKSLPPPGIQEPKHPPATKMVQMQLWD